MNKLIQILALSACVFGVAVAAEAPTQEEASKGLNLALGSLVNQVVGSDSATKDAASQMTINLPDKLKKLESALQAAGQGQLMEDFKAKLKEVAVKTLPMTKDVFAGETSNLKFDDALAVLKTGPDGLTNYTKQHTRKPVISKVQPLIEQQSKEHGITESYKAMVSKVGPFAASMFGKEPPASLEQSVTEQTVDYVYGQMAKGEGVLRANPATADNALVKKLFAAVKK
jgi:hypothetical protein